MPSMGMAGGGVWRVLSGAVLLEENKMPPPPLPVPAPAAALGALSGGGWGDDSGVEDIIMFMENNVKNNVSCNAKINSSRCEQCVHCS